jgi:hypothetical protein
MSQSELTTVVGPALKAQPHQTHPGNISNFNASNLGLALLASIAKLRWHFNWSVIAKAYNGPIGSHNLYITHLPNRLTLVISIR